MSFILKQNGKAIATATVWNPQMFGKKINTSFPSVVDKSYVWEVDDYWLGWVEPPPAPEPTQEEKDQQKASEVRAQRDQLLAETDWTQVLDAPVDRTVWVSYRQALRDIPDQPGFPFNVVWPQKP